jgi:hypothetical protein
VVEPSELEGVARLAAQQIASLPEGLAKVTKRMFTGLQPALFQR